MTAAGVSTGAATRTATAIESYTNLQPETAGATLRTVFTTTTFANGYDLKDIHKHHSTSDMCSYTILQYKNVDYIFFS